LTITLPPPHLLRWPEFPEFARQNFRNPHPYYWRGFETRDDYFDYYRDYHAFWKLYGIDLPDNVLKMVYHRNALNHAGRAGRRLSAIARRQYRAPWCLHAAAGATLVCPHEDRRGQVRRPHTHVTE